MDDARKRRLVQRVASEVAYVAGRPYQIDLDALDERSLRELRRLLRDLDAEKHSALRRARIFPWRI